MKAVKIPAPQLATTAPLPRTALPRAGQIVGERYRLEEWLERGAMGSVWRAKQIRLRSPAAVKFLDPSLIEVPEMLERFLQEARSAAAVQSAHVVQVFDYGSEGGLPYIAMEFLEGENLDSRLAKRGVLTPAELDKIFSELARGLGQAHAMGVIHRDVKPGNIFLTREGKHEVTKLIDFGIAKVKADALRVSQIVGTELGTLLGTPQYMSPEQVRGRTTVDYRTDLWALAIIACECLTGRYPFAGTTIGDLSVQICTEEPFAPSLLGDVPAGFDQWFFKGTSKEPSQRFASAADMADALTKILVPDGHAAATVQRRPLLVLPSVLALRQAWSGTASRVLRHLALAFERARALGSMSAVTLRTHASKLTHALDSRSLLAQSAVAQTIVEVLRRPGVRRLWSRTAAVGLALLVVGCLVVWRPRRAALSATAPADIAAHAISDDSVSHEARALLASTPAPDVRPAPVVPLPEPVTRPTLPVLNPDDLPLVATTETRPNPVKAPQARRRVKRQGPPVSADSSPASQLSPMSTAMGRLGALLAQGGDEHHPVRAKNTATAAARTQERASTKTDAESRR